MVTGIAVAQWVFNVATIASNPVVIILIKFTKTPMNINAPDEKYRFCGMVRYT